jgi:predicted nuclease of predicted toxin-antitoxin system
MRFKLDENLPAILASDLAHVGHDATTCQAEGIAGNKDAVIASHAASEGRILITFDLDFSDIRKYPPGTHPGIVVFRTHNQDITTCRTAFARLSKSVDEADFHGNLIIVENFRVRIRRP